jgi:hypothetical protein
MARGLFLSCHQIDRLRPALGQQVVDTANGMKALGIEVTEPGGLDQAMDRRGTLAAPSEP